MIVHCIPLSFSQCFMHLDVCLNIGNCVLVGLDWVEPMMQLFLARHMFMHISCVCTFSFPSLYSLVIVCFVFSLSLSRIDYTWHPSTNLLRLGTLFIPGHLPLLILSFPLFTLSFVMRRPIKTSLRTSLNVAFI